MVIQLTKDELAWCRQLGVKRSDSMAHSDTINSENMVRGTPWERHYYGAIGEKTWSKASGEPVNDKTIGEGDDGTDFSNGTQIKASKQPNRPNLLFPVSQYKRKIAKRYILIWIKEKNDTVVCEILGQISREKVDRVKRFVKKGEMNMKDDTWFVNNRYLTEAII